MLSDEVFGQDEILIEIRIVEEALFGVKRNAQ